MTRSVAHVLTVLLLVTSVPFAVTAKKKKKKQEPVKTEEAYVDLYKYAGDDWLPVWKPTIKRANERKLEALSATALHSPLIAVTETVAVDDGVPRETRGFRVQLVNVMDEAVAKSIQERAEKIFDDVYIIFRSPNYKVRVGDFVTRSQADAAVDTARVHGFRDVWVVPSKVFIKHDR